MTSRDPKAKASAPAPGYGSTTPFRFYDNRQKYLAFVNTCNEKAVIAARCAEELAVAPAPPALRIFDAGMGDGRCSRASCAALHRHFPTCRCSRSQGNQPRGRAPGPGQDARALLEHPHTVLVITNLDYADAPAAYARGPAGRSSAQLAGGAFWPGRRARLRRTDRGARTRCWLTAGRPGPARRPGTRLRAALGARHLSRRITSSCSTT